MDVRISRNVGNFRKYYYFIQMIKSIEKGKRLQKNKSEQLTQSEVFIYDTDL